MRTLSTTNVLSLALLAIAATATTQVTLTSTISITSPTRPHFDYILTILLENQGINQTIGKNCPGNCTYITQLANTYGLVENYSDIGHPSLPNYLALTSGGNYDTAPFNTDCQPQSSGCQVSAPNIIDAIENSSRTWRAYMEDYTGGGCTHTGDSYYDNNHNPFVYYTDITSNSTRCTRIVDANPGESGYLALPTQLLTDLNATSPANYMWLSPNLCDDGHTICKPLNNAVSQTNQYLSFLIPRILNTITFRTQQAALFITWDEASGETASKVAAIWAGPATLVGHKSVLHYNHFSALRTVETAWSLPTLTRYDSTAYPMTEFF